MVKVKGLERIRLRIILCDQTRHSAEFIGNIKNALYAFSGCKCCGELNVLQNYLGSFDANVCSIISVV
jgi:hypothetical protein